MTASLEQSVRVRTTQLEQALTHRQTFISSITHEVSGFAAFVGDRRLGC